jgi:hypothetical protein
MDGFWTLMSETRAAAGGNALVQVELLVECLSRTSPDRVREHAAQWALAMDRLHTWDLWGAATVMTGWCGDDDFDYFRAWLLCHGREAAERAVAAPDDLGDLGLTPVDGEPSLEEALRVSARAFDLLAGREDAWDQDADATYDSLYESPAFLPRGEPWPETVEGFTARWPRLWRAYGPHDWATPPRSTGPDPVFLNFVRPPGHHPLGDLPS